MIHLHPLKWTLNCWFHIYTIRSGNIAWFLLIILLFTWDILVHSPGFNHVCTRQPAIHLLALTTQVDASLFNSYCLVNCLHSVVRPSCLQATAASLASQRSSHTVPHCPRKHTSTRPSKLFLPPTSRISVLLQPATAKQNSICTAI